MASEFLLYSRSYCHLCDDMLDALQALQADYPFTVNVVDVDADPDLVALYDELVPVLIGRRAGTDTRLCHYFFQREQVEAWLRAADDGMA